MDGGLLHCTGSADQNYFSKKNKCRKAKWLSEEALQIAEKRREVKGKGKKRKIYPNESREKQREKRKPSSVINAKK